jgi:hypothetical protein
MQLAGLRWHGARKPLDNNSTLLHVSLAWNVIGQWNGGIAAGLTNNYSLGLRLKRTTLIDPTTTLGTALCLSLSYLESGQALRYACRRRTFSLWAAAGLTLCLHSA